MDSLNFNEGYKELAINGDESRILRINLSDSDLIVRFQKSVKDLENIAEKMKNIELKNDGTTDNSEEIKVLEEATNEVRKAIDYALNTNACEVAFGNQSPLSLVNGKYLFEGFLEALQPYIEEEIQKQRKLSKERTEKYTKVLKK